MKIQEVYGKKIYIVDFPEKYRDNSEFNRLNTLCLLLRADIIYLNSVQKDWALKEYAIKEIKSNNAYLELYSSIQFVELESCYNKYLKIYRKLQLNMQLEKHALSR